MKVKWGKLTRRGEVAALRAGEVPERDARIATDRIALIYEDRRITYREVNERANDVAAALQNHGFAKGDRLAVSLQNVPDIVYSHFGIANTTGIPKPAGHTHYASIMRATIAIDPLQITADDAAQALLPMFHPPGGLKNLPAEMDPSRRWRS